MTESEPVIHIIDDDDSVRNAVARLLKAAGYQVLTYSNAGEFLMAASNDSPGCIILDVRMPGPSGLELQDSLNRKANPLPIIFLTGHGDIPMSVQAMKAGAADFLTKPVQKHALLGAVRSALELHFQSRSKQQLVDHVRSCYSLLTERERQIFLLVIEGKLNKQIAASLGIAERTVKAHRAQVMEKMRVSSLADLVRLAGHLELENGQ
jgi:FixJ family two-component response regulator